MPIAVLTDPAVREHDPGPLHPERAERWDAAMRGLASYPVATRAARVATADELALCHSRAYLELAESEVRAGRHTLSTGDTDVCERSFDVARHAAGVGLDAVDLVLGGQATTALAIVRPPGHHAGAARGMGFCLFNNIAIAARYAQRRHGVERVLIADWDVHHGNGTQDIFYEDGSVFFFSTHQSPWYPGTGARDETGAGGGRAATMNRPFPAGAGREEVLGALGELAQAMEGFRPDIVLISAGFDSRRGDPLGQFRLSDQDFADMTDLLLEVADKHAGGRVISLLEGGYNLEGLALGVASHARALERAGG